MLEECKAAGERVSDKRVAEAAGSVVLLGFEARLVLPGVTSINALLGGRSVIINLWPRHQNNTG